MYEKSTTSLTYCFYYYTPSLSSKRPFPSPPSKHEEKTTLGHDKTTYL